MRIENSKNIVACLLLGLIISLVNCGFVTKRENKNISELNTDDKKSSQISFESKRNENNNKSYIGCWSGMRGGMIEITAEEIYDLVADKRASYEEVEIIKNEEERFLLKTNKKISKYFPRQYILFIYEDSKPSAIKSFNSYEDFKKGKFAGMGVFGKMPCDKLKKHAKYAKD